MQQVFNDYLTHLSFSVSNLLNWVSETDYYFLHCFRYDDETIQSASSVFSQKEKEKLVRGRSKEASDKSENKTKSVSEIFESWQKAAEFAKWKATTNFMSYDCEAHKGSCASEAKCEAYIKVLPTDDSTIIQVDGNINHTCGYLSKDSETKESSHRSPIDLILEFDSLEDAEAYARKATIENEGCKDKNWFAYEANEEGFGYFCKVKSEKEKCYAHAKVTRQNESDLFLVAISTIHNKRVHGNKPEVTLSQVEKIVDQRMQVMDEKIDSILERMTSLFKRKSSPKKGESPEKKKSKKSDRDPSVKSPKRSLNFSSVTKNHSENSPTKSPEKKKQKTTPNENSHGSNKSVQRNLSFASEEVLHSQTSQSGQEGGTKKESTKISGQSGSETTSNKSSQSFIQDSQLEVNDTTPSSPTAGVANKQPLVPQPSSHVSVENSKTDEPALGHLSDSNTEESSTTEDSSKISSSGDETESQEERKKYREKFKTLYKLIRDERWTLAKATALKYKSDLPTIKAPKELPTDFSRHISDAAGMKLLRGYDEARMRSSRPLHADPDHNCLCNSAMINLFGSQENAWLLRLRAAIELIQNYDKLMSYAKKQTWKHTIENSLLNALDQRMDVDMLMIESVARILKIHIESVIVAPTEMINTHYSMYNTTLGKSQTLKDPLKIQIMWTCAADKKFEEKGFTFNHLVPLVGEPTLAVADQQDNIATVDDDFEDAYKENDYSYSEGKKTVAEEDKSDNKENKTANLVKEVQADSISLTESFNGRYKESDFDEAEKQLLQKLEDLEKSGKRKFLRKKLKATLANLQSLRKNLKLSGRGKVAKSMKLKKAKIETQGRKKKSREIDIDKLSEVEFLEWESAEDQDEGEGEVNKSDQGDQDEEELIQRAKAVKKDRQAAFKTGDDDLDEHIESLNGSPLKFMTNSMAIRVCALINQVSKLPSGLKGDSRFVIENMKNVKIHRKRREGLIDKNEEPKGDYSDDRGQWTGLEPDQHWYVFARTGGAGTVFTHQRGVRYFKGTFFKNRIPLRHQFEKENFILLKETKFLHINKIFQKKCTEFIYAPSDLEHLCSKMLVEYSGDDYKIARPHGGSRLLKRNYMRKAKELREKAKELARQKKKPDEIHAELINVEDPHNSITDLKQAQNFVEAVAKENRHHGSGRSIADQISVVQKMHQDPKYHKYIHQIFWNSEKRRPGIVMYTDRSLQDLVTLSRGKSPLICGIDKTFELSSCFATIITYRQANLINNNSQGRKSPLFACSVLLHYDSTEETFHSYLSHLKFKLQKINEDLNIKGFEISSKDPLFSSDQEKPLVGAIQKVWPGATIVYCHRHLEENLGRWLEKTKQVSFDEKRRVINAFFNEKDGIIYAKDSVSLAEAQTKFENDFPDLLSDYMDSYFMKIRNNLKATWFHDNLSFAHKNNLAEAFNSLVKNSKVLRTTLSVPGLIKVFVRIFDTQEAMCIQAIRNVGRLSLQPWMKHVYVDPDLWQYKTDAEKKKKINEFFRGPKITPAMQMSKDGTVSMENLSKIAQKKNKRAKRKDRYGRKEKMDKKHADDISDLDFGVPEPKRSPPEGVKPIRRGRKAKDQEGVNINANKKKTAKKTVDSVSSESDVEEEEPRKPQGKGMIKNNKKKLASNVEQNDKPIIPPILSEWAAEGSFDQEYEDFVKAKSAKNKRSRILESSDEENNGANKEQHLKKPDSKATRSTRTRAEIHTPQRYKSTPSPHMKKK